jgi:hypothetical protein
MPDPEDISQWRDRAPGDEAQTDDMKSQTRRDAGLSERSGMSEDMTLEERDLENTWSTAR